MHKKFIIIFPYLFLIPIMIFFIGCTEQAMEAFLKNTRATAEEQKQHDNDIAVKGESQNDQDKSLKKSQVGRLEPVHTSPSGTVNNTNESIQSSTAAPPVKIKKPVLKTTTTNKIKQPKPLPKVEPKPKILIIQ